MLTQSKKIIRQNIKTQIKALNTFPNFSPNTNDINEIYKSCDINKIMGSFTINHEYNDNDDHDDLLYEEYQIEQKEKAKEEEEAIKDLFN